MISITLPSLHPELIEKTLDNISEVTMTHTFEVLVCTPHSFEPWASDHGSCIYVGDKIQNGCVAAHAAAARMATGNFITSFADDHDYARGWDEMAVENFLRREQEGSRPLSLGLRQVSSTPHVGTMFGIYYPYFPFMRLADARAIGGWYDDSCYVNGFSDPDLGMRVWKAGGRCEWADQATISPRPEDSARRGAPNYLDDAKTFLARWSDEYGKGWDLRHVRGWDLDVPLSTFGSNERTCFQDARVKPFVRAGEDV